MKKIYDTVRGIVGRTATYFTVIVLAFLLIVGTDDNGGDFNVKTSYFGFILLFAFFLSVIDLVLDAKAIRAEIVRIVIHYLLAATDFVVVLCLLSELAKSGARILALMLAFTAVYAAVIAARHFLVRSFESKSNSEKKYGELFGKEND